MSKYSPNASGGAATDRRYQEERATFENLKWIKNDSLGCGVTDVMVYDRVK